MTTVPMLSRVAWHAMAAAGASFAALAKFPRASSVARLVSPQPLHMSTRPLKTLELLADRERRRQGSDCVYETKRVKPGLKPGAVEMLQRRLGKLRARCLSNARFPWIETLLISLAY